MENKTDQNVKRTYRSALADAGDTIKMLAPFLLGVTVAVVGGSWLLGLDLWIATVIGVGIVWLVLGRCGFKEDKRLQGRDLDRPGA